MLKSCSLEVVAKQLSGMAGKAGSKEEVPAVKLPKVPGGNAEWGQYW